MRDQGNISGSATKEELLLALESLSRDNAALAKTNAELVADMHKTTQQLNEHITYLQGELDSLIEQIKMANQRYFGSKSERIIPEQISLFNEMEAAADSQVPEPSIESSLQTKPHRRGGKRTIDYSKFETVVVEHTLDDDKKVCKQCGSTLDQMNVEITRTVKLVPAHLVVEEHHRHVYLCKTCADANAKDGSVDTTIVRAPMPALPVAHSFASASLIAYVLNAKYVNSLPLYRLEADFKCLGADISRQNMANWTMGVWKRWLSLIHTRMKEKLLEGDIIHCDETTVQVLKEPNKAPKSKSYTWLFCASACAQPNYIYEYHPTRSGSVVAHFFEGWHGTITTDGYDPYFKLGPDIVNTACLVHVRRKFAEIVKVAGGDAKAASVESIALEARRRIDKMFAVDSRFDDMDPVARKQARDKELKPLMDEFLDWANRKIVTAVPKMALHKALAYAIKYWPYVENVLDDGRLELSNNIAERAVKPFVIGRKNWLFSDTPKGAQASAAIYSIVTTAKANGLNPRAYLEWLLTEMPNTEGLDERSVLDRFLPWSQEVPDTCRLSDKAAEKAAEMADEPILDVDAAAFDKD